MLLQMKILDFNKDKVWLHFMKSYMIDTTYKAPRYNLVDSPGLVYQQYIVSTFITNYVQKNVQ